MRVCTEFPEPLERIREQLLRAGRWTGELTHRRKNGSKIVMVSRWSLARDADGRLASVLETNNDITARKRIERQLHHHQEELERMVTERTAELRQTVRPEARAWGWPSSARPPSGCKGKRA